MIIKRGSWYYVVGHKKDPRTGKRRVFGKYRTRKEAERRLRQIQYFKYLSKRR
jgi:hypothetical protein